MSDIIDLISQGIKETNPKLEQLSRNRVSVRDAAAKIIPLSELGSVMGNEEDRVSGVGMTLINKPVLKLLFLMTQEASDKLIEAVIGKSGIENEALCKSLLQEIGNIFGSVVTNSISSKIKAPLKTSPPEVIHDLAGAILSSIICEMGHIDDDVLMISTEITVDNNKIDCGIFLFHEEGFIEKISNY